MTFKQLVSRTAPFLIAVAVICLMFQISDPWTLSYINFLVTMFVFLLWPVVFVLLLVTAVGLLVLVFTGIFAGVRIAQGSFISSLFCHRVWLLVRFLIPTYSILLTGFCLLWLSSIPPSNEYLERRFFRHRSDLEHIVAMMDQDLGMVRIAPSFTRRNDNWNENRREPEWGISRQRWDEYRTLFRRAGLPNGAQREDFGEIELFVWDVVLSIAGRSVGYLHCGSPDKTPAHAFETSPCSGHRDKGEIRNKSMIYRYKRITGDWYIFDWRF
jgi:hypothetical protein